MKLKKLLLPVAGVASVAAVVAPVVTSCGTGLTFSSKIKEDGTLEKKYESKIDKKTGTVTDVEKTYFEDIESNKKILADDFLVARSEWTPETVNADTKYSGKVSVSVSISKFSATDKTMSATIKLNGDIKASDEDDAGEMSIKQSMSYTCKNVPVATIKDTDTGKWAFTLGKSCEDLKKDDKWSIIFAESGTFTLKDEKGNEMTQKTDNKTTYNKDYISEEIYYIEILPMITFDSHYLSDIQ